MNSLIYKHNPNGGKVYADPTSIKEGGFGEQFKNVMKVWLSETLGSDALCCSNTCSGDGDGSNKNRVIPIPSTLPLI